MEKVTEGYYSKGGSHLFPIWTLNIEWKIEIVFFFEGCTNTKMNRKCDSGLQRISRIQQFQYT